MQRTQFDMSGSVVGATAVVAAPPGPSQRAGRQRGMLIASRAHEGARGSRAPAWPRAASGMGALDWRSAGDQ
jgi:hypothetical protein